MVLCVLDSSEVFYCYIIYTALGTSKMAGIPSQTFYHLSFDYKKNLNNPFYFGAIAYAFPLI